MGCKSIFITATGTDMGKTYISALLVKKMRDMGFNCGYYKPVLSGAKVLDDGSLLCGDCDYVVKFSGLNVNPSRCVSYCFEEAVSPHLAAFRSEIKIEKSVIKSDYKKLCANYDYMVLEGAGGITCPFCLGDEKFLLSDLISDFGFCTIVVADAGLGTINSVLLTYYYAKSLGIKIAAFVLNNYDENNFMHRDNKIQIENLTGIKVAACVKNGDKDIDIDKETLLKFFD